ncbi:MAG: PQQ-binding-like beta-propeller repeat protein [Planctomycetota bacterium]|nr:PQQ-binding-like beta-propeller repeat protein [Planctomycetota bacterium]
MVRCTVVPLLLLTAVTFARAEEPEAQARQIFEATGIKGGLVVHLGCGNGRLTAALRPSESFLVHGLDRSDAHIAEARTYLHAQNLYGEISVDRLDGNRLPYIDNLVNLLVAEDLDGVTLDEVKRVLVPNGAAYVKLDGAWQKIVKPRPAEYDDWTHYYYDARGNAVSKDLAVAPPKHLQWVGSPRWSRHHDRISSLSAEISSNGRLYYIMDEGSRISILLPSKWTLIARDAFNGTILWKKPIEHWQNQLWPLKSGPTQLTRRLVGEGDRIYVTLGIDQPVSCIDGATGELLRVYGPTKGAEEILVRDGILYVLVNPKEWALEDFAPKFNTGDQKRVETEFNWDGQPRELHAIEAATGKTLWKKTGVKVAPITLAADGQKVVFFDDEKIVCLDAATGEQKWASPPEPRRRSFEYNFGPRLLLHGKMVLYAGGDGTMRGLDAESGQEKWNAPHQKSGYRSPEDLIVAGGKVWNAPTLAGSANGVFVGRNPETGAVESEFPPDVDTYWFHHRCYIAKATERFILTSRTGIEFVDFEKKHWEINHWVRAACLYGTLPSNGLIYAGPHDCACYPEAKLFGINALAPARAEADPRPPADAERLERGPAYDQKVDEVAADAKDWPVYRHDNARSGRTDQEIPEVLEKAFETSLGGRLTPPVVAAGLLFVSQVECHTLHAFDAVTGKPRWTFTAGARVDAPPAYWNGRLLFGGMDGCVYCLRASDGALIWRFRAAPDARRHMAFEQLESVWPVHGSVLVENGAVNFVAGRSVFLDGGLRYLKLDAATGKKLTEEVYDDKDPESGKNLQVRVKTLQMPVGLNDILSSDGHYLYLRSQKIGPDGKRVDIGPVSGDAARQGAAQKGEGSHIFAPMGFLDDSWFHRSYWVFGKNFAGGHSGYYQAGKYAPSGQILVFDDQNVYSYGRKDQYFKWTTTIEHQLMAASREAPNVEPPPETKNNKKNAAKTPEPEGPHVTFPDHEKLDPAGKPLTVEAWVLAEDKDGVVLSHGGSANGLALALDGGKPAFSARCDKELATAQAADPLSEGWHHLAGVLTATSITLYVDGKEAASQKSTGLVAKKPSVGLYLGASGSSRVSDLGQGKNFTGALDQLAIYHRALSADEVAGHAQAKAATVDPDAVLALAFDAGSAKDLSANKINGVAHDTGAAEGKFGGALGLRVRKENPKEQAQAQADSNSDEKDAGKAKEGKAYPVPATPNKGSYVNHQWTASLSIYGRAMAMAGKTILVAGPPDMVDEEYAFERLVNKDKAIAASLMEQAQALENKGGASMVGYSSSGEAGQNVTLDSSPVWDGMIVAQGRIYLCGLDGKIYCYAAKAADAGEKK